MRNSIFFLPFLISILNAQSPLQKENEEKIRAVENSLAGRVKISGEPGYNIIDRMRHYKINGLSIAVVENYQVTWAKGYGMADAEKKKPVTINTLFEPGSISKSLNAVGLLKLSQDKKVDLYTDINTYLTSWKFPYDSISGDKKITLAQLLSHSAGLTVHGFPGYNRIARIPTLQQVLDGEEPANTPAVRSLFEPGSHFKYSGGGTTISQLLLTDVTGEIYENYMYENILKPMGMTHSFYNQPPSKDREELCASGYWGDGVKVEGDFNIYPEQGAAGLWMTPTDLCHYIIETQLAYQGKSAKVLNREMTRLRLKPYNDSMAALGVFIENRKGTRYFQHGAGNAGFSGIYYGSMEGGNGVAIFLNSNNSAILNEVVNSVAAVYNWENFYSPLIKKEVKVNDELLQKYDGIYIFEGNWAGIYRKDGKCYFLSDDIESRMHFTSPSEFFNEEFLSEKKFMTDTKGHITGYERRVGGVQHPSAAKVTVVDTLHLEMHIFNSIGWHMLENKRYAAAESYLNRGLQLYPGNLLMLGNLAHVYLFSNNQKAAMDIYKAHLTENVEEKMSWKDMINADFIFFKKNGFDKKIMQKVYSDLEMKSPEGF